MLRPSYLELINAVNKQAEDDKPVVQSRYSIVIATAKRARQLIDGMEPTVAKKRPDEKPLSVAVDELYQGSIHILPADAKEDEA